MKFHLIAIFFVMTILPSAAFAQSEIDKDPFTPGNQFDQKPLDEHELDMEFLNQLWTICVAVVISMVVVRVALKIIKKRMQAKEEPE
jgi:hypothetical protein